MKEQFNSNVVDHSLELQAIKNKYGARFHHEPKATQEAAELWELETNKHGVAQNIQTEVLISEKRITAEIYLARTRKNYWLIGISAHTSMPGIGYAPSAWDRTGFTSYDAARKQAIQNVKNFFCRSASEKEKPFIIQKLAEKETVQLSLF
jgi:hypothetical protein